MKGRIYLLFSLYLVSPLAAQGATQEPEKKSTDEVSTDQKIDILAAEIEKMKAGQKLFPELKEKGVHGLGPAASKVYNAENGLSLGGYGEIIYERYDRTNQKGTDVTRSKIDRVDLLKAILYAGYKFDNHWTLNSEIEFEHGHEISVEFLYVDCLASEALNFRIGHMLVPMGLTNEMHEPPVFLGVFRPLSETYIIPGTWSEPGLGIFGGFHDFAYKLYAINGFDGAGTHGAGGESEGFSAETGFRGGRSEGKEASARTFAAVSRIDYRGINGLNAGVSGYYGKSAQENDFNGELFIGDVHAEIVFQGFQIRLLAVYSRVRDVTEIYNVKSAAAATFTPEQSIGSRVYGGYFELGYDILRLFNIQQELMLFGRAEKIDTQYKMPDGFSKDGANEQLIQTWGVRWKPIHQLSFKLDYRIFTNKTDTGLNRLNFGVGYIF